MRSTASCAKPSPRFATKMRPSVKVALSCAKPRPISPSTRRCGTRTFSMEMNAVDEE